MLKVDLGIFAHDEAEGIGAMLDGLLRQDVFSRPDIDLRVVVLANGCRDDTVAVARAAAGGRAEVLNLPEGGKSRTWNRFVHDLSRPDAQYLLFCDADISWIEDDSLTRMLAAVAARPSLWVLNSQPVKDLAIRGARTVVEKLALKAAGGLDNWKTAICGQLYAMPAARARLFCLPVGLPVEDGFLRAMVLTDLLAHDEDLSRIDGLEGLRHIYASETGLSGLLRHQERIVIGGAVNACLFAWLRDHPVQERAALLEQAARDEGALPGILRARLPRPPYGFVPFHFLTKRLRPVPLRRIPVMLTGVCFDAIVYLRAQIRMARGAGSGFW